MPFEKPRNPDTQIKLRLRDDLRRRLEQEASHRRHTLNNEVRIRLEDSFDQGARRDLEDIVTDLKVNWGRFAARFLRMELADQLADCVLAERGNPEQAQMLALLIVEHRSAERRGLGGVS